MIATQTPTATQQLSALAHETRLGIFSLLMTHMPEGLPAGEISDTLGVSPSNLSAHLAILNEAGLISVHPRGRLRIYTIELDAIGQLINFLVADCCQSNPQVCSRVDLSLETC